MKFYEIDEALGEAVANQRFDFSGKRVRLRVRVDAGGQGCFEEVCEQDIVSADFYCLKEAAGGVSSRGEVVLENPQGIYAYSGIAPGCAVQVLFSLGEGLPFFERFALYLDHKGVQDIRGPGRKRFARLGLRDLSAKLLKTDEAKDWAAPAVFDYSVVCDKTNSDKSLVHGIAKRAGLGISDIDCSTIGVTLPYVRLRKNIWAELSSLAKAYRCHLECPVEKPLVFAHSPYQSEPLDDSDCSYTFSGDTVFYLRATARADQYRNTVRLKINLPVALEKQEIWRYEDAPVFYDDFFQPHYPCRYPLVRDIEAGAYEARYRVRDAGGKERAVIFANDIDTKEEAESRLDYDGGAFRYSLYDVTAHHDRAVLTLQKDNDGDLYHAVIFGRPIVLDLNRSCFLTDREGVAAYGTAALNVSGSYFSEYDVGGKAQYEDWVSRELAERLRPGRELTVKTHRALFHARVGARVKLEMRNEELKGVINAFHLRYRKNEMFVATFRITEQG